MTTMTSSIRNGRKRLSLDEQINRLDQTLDGLADGLNEAVADAVKMAVGNAVREAVQCVLTEVLTNPDILAKMQATATPKIAVSAPREAAEPPKSVSLWYRLGRLCGRIRDSLANLRQTLRTSAGNIRVWKAERLTALSAICQMLSPFRYHVMTAVGIGLLGSKAAEATGRNPGAAGNILTLSIILAALIEGIVFFAIFLAK